MAIPPLLVLNGFDTLPIQVHELVGGTTPTQIGSDIPGTNLTWSSNVTVKGNHSNFVVNFKGENYCIVFKSGNTVHVHKENEGGAGVWGSVFNFTAGTSLTTASEYLLTVVRNSDGSDLMLVVAGPATANNYKWGKSTTGQTGSWTEVVASSVSTRMTSTPVVYRNKIHFTDGQNVTTGASWELDPVADTLTKYTGGWTETGNREGNDLCVAFDKLWCVGTEAYAAGEWRLYEFTGGGWTFNGAISATSTVNGNAADAKCCLWTDNTNLYLVGPTFKDELGNTSAKQGSTVWRGVPTGSTFTWTQDDGTMVSGLQPGDRGNNNNFCEDRWGIIVDNDTDPTNPAYYLAVAEGPAPGLGFAVYRWEGFGFEMGSGVNTGEVGPGASVSIAYNFPETKHGGGIATSQGVATYADIVGETPLVAAYRLSYRVWGTGSGLTGRVYFSTEQGPPDTLATFLGGGTTINSITGDSGVAIRTVDIDLSLSGITAPDDCTWMIDLS